MREDTIMALTVLGCFFMALGTVWADEMARRRAERKFRAEIEALHDSTADL